MAAAEPYLDVSGEPRSGEGWTGSALGLTIIASFPVPGLRRDLQSETVGTLELRLVDDPPRWKDAGRLVGGLRGDDGRFVVGCVDHGPEGFRVWGTGLGEYRVTRDGRLAECAPGATPTWSWQRFLIGQVLPLSATLQGLVLLHASAVVLADRLVLVAGPSGAGKSSTAFELLHRGAEFFADDVVAVAPGGPAHPGPALLSVGHHLERKGLGTAVGRTARATLVGVPRPSAPRPLDVLYLLRTTSGVSRPEVVPASDPQLALVANYVGVPTDVEAGMRMLDVCAGLFNSGRLRELRVPPRADPSRTAEVIAADVRP